MGNTQVTPIRPAIPPLINLAGKLEEGDDDGERDKIMKCSRSLDKNKAALLLIILVVVSHSALPDLLVSHLSEAPAGQSVKVCVSEFLSGRPFLLLLFVPVLCFCPTGSVCSLMMISSVVSLWLLLLLVRGYL